MSRKEDTAPNLATGQLADLILTEQEAVVQVILRTDGERRRLADNRRAIEKKERELSVERERQFNDAVHVSRSAHDVRDEGLDSRAAPARTAGRPPAALT